MNGTVDTVAAAAVGIDPRAAAGVRVLVMTGYGLNCEAETAAGFATLGCKVELRHVGDLLDRTDPFAGFSVLAFIGGFSFGDHVASGRVYANRLRFRLGDQLARFVDAKGLVVGMCNGFQTMVKLGLLPALDRPAGGSLAPQQVSLVSNDRVGYRDAWVRMVADETSPCLWTHGMGRCEMPSRHAEGKLVFGDVATLERLSAEHLVPLRYVDADGSPTERWPDNPNGSAGGAAALCDPSGRVFGLMPHPEAYLVPENHPRWRARLDAGEAPVVGEGLRLLANGVTAALAASS